MQHFDALLAQAQGVFDIPVANFFEALLGQDGYRILSEPMGKVDLKHILTAVEGFLKFAQLNVDIGQLP